MLYDPHWEKKHKTKKLKGWRRVLWDAANLIEAKGWIQHKEQSKKGLCIGEAIDRVAPDLHVADIAEIKLCKTIGTGCIMYWNDQPERTKRQVLAVLRAVARR
jgi:hypothetical protein